MNLLIVAEDDLLQDSRAQRAAIDKEMRRILMLLDAGIPLAEAEQIITDVAGEIRGTIHTEPERQAA